jgi:hypothetical protein
VRFANGVYGYADDWLADGPGWVTFDELFATYSTKPDPA